MPFWVKKKQMAEAEVESIWLRQRLAEAEVKKPYPFFKGFRYKHPYILDVLMKMITIVVG